MDELEEYVRFGNAVASLCVEKKGAIPAMPTLAQVEKQIKYNFVPEKHTDFIFCTVGEEWGFLGAVAVLGVMCLLLLRLMKMGERQEEPFGRVYCYSVAAILLFHVLVNVGMTIGLMPVMGIPLPFMSYGGSSLLAFTILLFIAIRLDASTRQFPST